MSKLLQRSFQELPALLEQISEKYNELCKQNEELRRALKEAKRRQKRNILGFSLMKRRKSKNSYAYCARKKIDGKLIEVYLGADLQGAKEKIQEKLKVIEAQKGAEQLKKAPEVRGKMVEVTCRKDKRDIL
jgi:hypothetical protein